MASTERTTTADRAGIISVVTSEEAAAPSGPARRLIERLDAEGIACCDWIGGGAGDQRRGRADLDLLVDPRRTGELLRILGESGFRRYPCAGGDADPAVEDHLLLDAPTGRLTHVRVHHRLHAGRPHRWEYRLPWETAILETRRPGPHGVPGPDPDLAMLLLLVCRALELRLRDRVVGRGDDFDRRGLAGEFARLRKETSVDGVAACARRFLGEESVGIVKSLVIGGPARSRLARLAHVARRRLEMYRRESVVGGAIRGWFREMNARLRRLNQRFIGLPIPGNRIVPSGGVIVALVGSDGSGKSTVCEDLIIWLSPKLDVYPVYFGSGDGRSSLIRWPLKQAYRWLVARPAASRPRSPRDEGEGRGGRLRRFRPIWALVLSWEKRKKLGRAWRARNRGMVVICDRYPQNQMMGFNDGPLLSGWNDHRSPWRRALAAWERVPYIWAEQQPPDLLLKMTVSPQVAVQRKPDMHEDEVRRRIEAVEALRFEKTRVHPVDTDRPLEDVIREVRGVVWAEL